MRTMKYTVKWKMDIFKTVKWKKSVFKSVKPYCPLMPYQKCSCSESPLKNLNIVVNYV